MSSNLPVQLTSFIGRQQELSDLQHGLAGTRLLTLTGPGGSGKTRLAIELARLKAPDFPGGVTWVDLVSLSDESLVAQTIAFSLDVHPLPGQDAAQGIVDFLGDKPLLLVLDNCEHLIGACAQIVDHLLRSCPAVKVLATSLEPLRIAGESAWPVPPLSLPDSDLGAPAIVGRSEAVKLFMARVKNVKPGFDLNSDNSAAVSRICRRLDGQPLAIELAASRADMLTPQQIAARLDDRFSLLKSRVRTGSDPRHQTMLATIDWSYQLLSAAEQSMLRRTSIFESAFSLSAAEATCGGGMIKVTQIFELLGALVARSLIQADTSGSSEARYRLLETIRAYALQQLKEAGEYEAMRERHLNTMMDTVEQATPYLIGSSQKSWFAWLQDQQDDIRAALRFSLESGRITAGLKIINTLSRSQYWAEQRTLQEWQNWMAQYLEARPEDLQGELLLTSLLNATSFCGLLGNSVPALDYGKKALALAKELGDEDLMARTLNSLGRAYAAGGDFNRSYELNEQAVSIHRQRGSTSDVGYVNLNVALDAISLGWFDKASEKLEESMTLARKTQQPLLEAHTYNVMGELEFCREAYEAAYHAYESGLPLLQRAKAERDVAALLLRLGFTHLQLGDPLGADGRFCEYKTLQEKSDNEQGLSEYLTGYGALAFDMGQAELAGKLLATAVLQAGAATMAYFPTGRFMYERYLARVREQLGENRFRESQAAGRRLSLDQSLGLIEEKIRPLLGTFAVRAQRREPLTERQSEVAILVGQGKSNGQIAEELVISKRTVEKHVANILAALDLENRAQIIRWVMEEMGRGGPYPA